MNMYAWMVISSVDQSLIFSGGCSGGDCVEMVEMVVVDGVGVGTIGGVVVLGGAVMKVGVVLY